jgi:cytochrome c-type biogenesis protein CcmE
VAVPLSYQGKVKNDMKTTHILALIAIAAGLAVIITTYNSDSTTYGNFSSTAASAETVKLIGQLVKEKPIEYNPEKDPNYLAFYLRDDQGEVRKVVLRASKPQDFERSEQVVLTGKMQGEIFMADDMQLKCPSKYKDEETYIRGQAQS